MRLSKGISARFRRNLYCSTALAVALSPPAIASVQPAKAMLDIPAQPLALALQTFSIQTNSQVLFSNDLVAGRRAPRIKGQYVPKEALAILIEGTGLHVEQSSDSVFLVKPNVPKHVELAQAARRAPAAPAAAMPATVETVVVTAQKKSENIQNVPIAVTALSQAQLTERQIAGGPDLVKEVPNLTFSKTNFTGYNLEIRGIGTQAISVTTDPAVAVAFNGIPFIRNHFFEQEFYDLQDVEVLRGPQGTLYGRNATAGVVNLKSAQPTDDYEAMLSADLGNFSNRRLEAMLNLPIVGDKLDVRFAGEWTKRDGYSFNALTSSPIDGRDLWSGRASLRWRPNSDVDVNLVWEHFQENDDRLRSGKQLCETAQPPTTIDGVVVPPAIGGAAVQVLNGSYLSQGCKASSLYAPSAFEVPNGFSLPYVIALQAVDGANVFVDPYASATQSSDLRVIESALTPNYQAKNDTIELNANYNVTSSLTLTSQTGYNQDFLWSTEDYNRFDTSPGIFSLGADSFHGRLLPDPTVPGAAIFCDPQLGCSDRLVGEDLSEEHAWQLSQEFRAASSFSGPFNFSTGGNYLHYETEENYYVFVNALTRYSVAQDEYGNGSTLDNSDCLQHDPTALGYENPNPKGGSGSPTQGCVFIDTSPIGSLSNYGHNYFLSQNPYILNSYAVFGEAYYQIADDLKLTGGLRWTEDQKHFTDIPSEVVNAGYGYPVIGVVDQKWDKLTGRATIDWMPKVQFTDQTLVYGSFSHGYKAGGANPPGAVLLSIGRGSGDVSEPIHPLMFKPEFIDAYELGTKNTLLNGTLTLNGDIFFYDYRDYQISEIVDRTSINLNFNAKVKGAELETAWEPLAGLKFSFAGGYEATRVGDGQSAIDLIDRTAGMPGWMVVKPFPTQASNCILPDYVVAALLVEATASDARYASHACGAAYNQYLDPVTLYPYQPNPTGIAGIGYCLSCSGNAGNVTYPIPAGYPGFSPTTAPNNGEGFAKNLGGNQLPNAPHFTTSLTAEYSMPVSDDWVGTLHADFYWQSQSWARIFNDKPYDKIHGYSNVNLSLILTSANGWQVMGYVKNVFDTTAITGDFLNSDDSGLTTNVFLTDPRLYGVRVTKQLDQSDGFWGSDYSGYDFFTDLFADKDGGRPPLWIELGGQADMITGQGDPFAPPFLFHIPTPPPPFPLNPSLPGQSFGPSPTLSVLRKGTTPFQAQKPSLFSFGEDIKVSFEPKGADWVVSAAARFGRASNFRHVDHQTNGVYYVGYKYGQPGGVPRVAENFADTQVHHKESHLMLDFTAGKEVGLGMFGLDGSSVLSGGVRIAQFASSESFDIRARPDLQFKYQTFGAFGMPGVKLKMPVFHTYHATGQSKRGFHGVGPTFSWKASTPVWGAQDDGITFNWGANAAMLFGRQRTRVKHQESAHYKSRLANVVSELQYTSVYHHPSAGHPTAGHVTDRTVAVPNLGGFAGISYRYNNAKISFGYRADEFFGAMDGGIDTRKSENVGFFGPYANISIGLGG